MSKAIKQKPEAKKFLKQKLVNYQNELKQQADIVIYDGYNTAGSQKFGLTTISRHSLEISSSQRNKYSQSNYEQYLNGFLQEDDFCMGKRSLTRQNILAMNKKSKIIKSNLNQAAKQRNFIEPDFLPYASLESSSNMAPQNLQNLPNPKLKQLSQNDLKSLLTIKQSIQQQTVHGSEKMRKASSQQSNRKRPHSTINIKPLSANYQSRMIPRNFSSLNPQTPDSQLMEYFTPCYHKQTKTGYIVSDFQPKIRAKHFEDNLKVMAKMIKKKISYLERGEIINYLKRIGQRKAPTSQDGKIQELVRTNNWLSQRNIMESKLVKAKKIVQHKQHIKKDFKNKN